MNPVGGRFWPLPRPGTITHARLRTLAEGISRGGTGSRAFSGGWSVLGKLVAILVIVACSIYGGFTVGRAYQSTIDTTQVNTIRRMWDRENEILNDLYDDCITLKEPIRFPGDTILKPS